MMKTALLIGLAALAVVSGAREIRARGTLAAKWAIDGGPADAAIRQLRSRATPPAPARSGRAQPDLVLLRLFWRPPDQRPGAGRDAGPAASVPPDSFTSSHAARCAAPRFAARNEQIQVTPNPPTKGNPITIAASGTLGESLGPRAARGGLKA